MKCATVFYHFFPNFSPKKLPAIHCILLSLFYGMDISFGFLLQLLWTFSRVMCSVIPVPTVYEQEINFVDSFRLTWTICTVIPTLSGCGGANEMVGRWSALQEMHILKSLWCWEIAILSGRWGAPWKLFCEMTMLFGTLLRFVIFFIDSFFDWCIFDNYAF